MAEDIFKTRRQTNRDIIENKIDDLIKTNISKQTHILECGETDYVSVEPNTIINITIYPTIKLNKSYKIIFSLTSKGMNVGQLSSYRKESNDDDRIFICVENHGKTRDVKIDYIICE